MFLAVGLREALSARFSARSAATSTALRRVGVMVKAVIWKVMLRRRGHRSYHYAATKYSQRDPRRGEAITVRNLDNTLVKAVIAHIAREQTRLKRRVFTVQADEV